MDLVSEYCLSSVLFDVNIDPLFDGFGSSEWNRHCQTRTGPG